MDKLKNTAQPWGDREQMTAKNTDQELWRERDGDFYSNSLSVTEHGGVCINVGGLVICKSLADWHSLAASRLPSNPAQGEEHPRADCEGCGHPDCPCNAPEVAQGGQKIAEPAKGLDMKFNEDFLRKVAEDEPESGYTSAEPTKGVQPMICDSCGRTASEERVVKLGSICNARMDDGMYCAGHFRETNPPQPEMPLLVKLPDGQFAFRDEVEQLEMPLPLVSDDKLTEIVKAAGGWFTETEKKLAQELQQYRREWAKKAGVR